MGIQQFPIQMYEDLLIYLNTKYKDRFWHALPRDAARFWKKEMVDKQAN
jgi:hypothetical protein